MLNSSANGTDVEYVALISSTYGTDFQCIYFPQCIAIIMPDDVSKDKVKALQCLGAEVQWVQPASIVDKQVGVHVEVTRAPSINHQRSAHKTATHISVDLV